VSFLLDTNVVSEERRLNGDPAVKRWMASVEPSDLYLSVLVVGEIRRGTELLRRYDAAQAAVFDSWLAGLKEAYGTRILPITGDIADQWGRLNARPPYQSSTATWRPRLAFMV